MLPMIEDAREFDMSRAMHVPLGLASPLWLPFAAATGAGLAFWWMTRWTQTANLEAFMSAMQPATLPEPLAMPSMEPAMEAAAAVSDAVVEQTEAVADVAVEAATEQVKEATEAVVDAAPAPKKKAKPDADAAMH